MEKFSRSDAKSDERILPAFMWYNKKLERVYVVLHNFDGIRHRAYYGNLALAEYVAEAVRRLDGEAEVRWTNGRGLAGNHFIDVDGMGTFYRNLTLLRDEPLTDDTFRNAFNNYVFENQ